MYKRLFVHQCRKCNLWSHFQKNLLVRTTSQVCSRLLHFRSSNYFLKKCFVNNFEHIKINRDYTLTKRRNNCYHNQNTTHTFSHHRNYSLQRKKKSAPRERDDINFWTLGFLSILTSRESWQATKRNSQMRDRKNAYKICYRDETSIFLTELSIIRFQFRSCDRNLIIAKMKNLDMRNFLSSEKYINIKYLLVFYSIVKSFLYLRIARKNHEDHK